MKKKHIFFRNDDVRGTLDESLIKITDIFIKHNVPITLAVEPANVSNEVVNWLLNLKKEKTGLIEIIQHGYKHQLNCKYMQYGKIRKGEFGNGRSYKEQFEEISKGKDLMNKYFGSNWFQAFTFPYGGKNLSSLKAVNNLGFKVMNDHLGIELKHKIFYFLGHLLRLNFILGRSVSYHLKNRPKSNLFNIDMSFSVISKYINEITTCKMFSLEEIITNIKKYGQEQETIGIILHHRYHNDDEKVKLIEDTIKWCKEQENLIFSTQEQIYNRFSK